MAQKKKVYLTVNNSDIIVIGLTGPFGSGCSTFAKFFDCFPEEEIPKINFNFIEFLRRYDYFSDENKKKGTINFDKLNNEIYDLYNLLEEIDAFIKKPENSIKEKELRIIKNRIFEFFKDKSKEKILNFIDKEHQNYTYLYSTTETLKRIRDRIFSELKVLLEHRESLNALNGDTSLLRKFIKEDIPSDIKCNDKDINQYHHFRRITVSDIIVFKTMLHLHKFNLKKIEKRKEKAVNEYRKIIEKCFQNIRREVKDKLNIEFDVKKYYKKFSKVKKLSGRNKRSRRKLEELKEIMKIIVKEIKKAKKEFEDRKPEIYRKLMQDFGDNIRRCGNPYDYKTSYYKRNLDRKYKDRLREEEKDTKYELVRDVKNIIDLLVKSSGHRVFIVDALRNPFEVLYLRKHFINFYLISIYAPKEIRFQRIVQRLVEKEKQKEKNVDIDKIKESFDENDSRDSGEGVSGVKLFYEQNVTACSRLADISINNYVAEDLVKLELEENNFKRGDNKEKRNIDKIVLSKGFLEKIEQYSFKEFERKIIRYLALIIDKGCTKPNDDEYLMNQAYAMAMKSNCISRQVGAVIVDKEGYIIGAGWNDVGEGHISCGLIEIKDVEKCRDIPMIREYFEKIEQLKGVDEDIKSELERLYFKNDKKEKKIPNDHCICFKDLISFKELERKIEKLKSEGRIEEEFFSKLESYLPKIYQKKLENCRALHAEENAILQSARRGGMGLKGAKLYTTTYPCPLCAKKIVQVGIEEVIFDDPYPTDLSEIFLQEGKRKVKLRHFEGVKPLGYFKLFKPDYDQKERQYFEVYNLVERFKYE